MLIKIDNNYIESENILGITCRIAQEKEIYHPYEHDDSDDDLDDREGYYTTERRYITEVVYPSNKVILDGDKVNEIKIYTSQEFKEAINDKAFIVDFHDRKIYTKYVKDISVIKKNCPCCKPDSDNLSYTFYISYKKFFPTEIFKYNKYEDAISDYLEIKAIIDRDSKRG